MVLFFGINRFDLLTLFTEPGTTCGITTAHHFDRLADLGIPVEEISRDTGYVLFHP